MKYEMDIPVAARRHFNQSGKESQRIAAKRPRLTGASAVQRCVLLHVEVQQNNVCKREKIKIKKRVGELYCTLYSLREQRASAVYLFKISWYK